MVVAETNDHWRKVRDLEGDECWTHKSKLSGAKMALVLEDGLPLYTRPSSTAPITAHLGRGVITRIEASRDDWLRISTKGSRAGQRGPPFGALRPATLMLRRRIDHVRLPLYLAAHKGENSPNGGNEEQL